MELELLNLIQQIRTPVGDVLMPLMTALGNAGILWIVMAVILLILPKYRKAGLVVAAALIVDLILCNGILKPLVARTRPCDVNTAIQLLVERPTDYSFPSGHTMASFAAVAALFFAGKRKLAYIMLIPACLISFSRMYLYLHYPTDVLAGLLLGILCGWIGYWLVGKLMQTEIGRKIVKEEN